MHWPPIDATTSVINNIWAHHRPNGGRTLRAKADLMPLRHRMSEMGVWVGWVRAAAAHRVGGPTPVGGDNKQNPVLAKLCLEKDAAGKKEKWR